MLEVELKFRLNDPQAISARLVGLGAVASDTVEQVDRYFNHPARDFAVTDEALRIRTVGRQSMVTYKGAKRPPAGAAAAKTRYELNLPVADHTTEGWAELLARLGFHEVAAVTKRRTSYHLVRDDWRFEVSVDEIDGLGVFAEVETLAEPDDRQAAEQAVHTLASEVGFTEPEPRSYLEMLLGLG